MDKINKNILDITNNYYKYLMNIENVIGIGLGYKIINNIQTKELCIHVLVKDKIESEYLTKNNIIPKNYMGIKTDVIKTGIAQICKDTYPQRVRPIEGGYSISVRDNKGYYHNGTLGCIVTKTTGGEKQYFILSNNHVIAATNSISPGTPIVQPSDNNWGNIMRDVVAHLSTFEEIKFRNNDLTAESFMDAAIAKISDEDFISNKIAAIGTISGVAKPELNMEVHKIGMVTGLSTGIITTTGMTIDVFFPGKKVATFKNQLKATLYHKKGDSGSVVLNNSNEVVGLLFAGTDSNTGIFTNIQDVLDKFNVSIYTG